MCTISVKGFIIRRETFQIGPKANGVIDNDDERHLKGEVILLIKFSLDSAQGDISKGLLCATWHSAGSCNYAGKDFKEQLNRGLIFKSGVILILPEFF